MPPKKDNYEERLRKLAETKRKIAEKEEKERKKELEERIGKFSKKTPKKTKKIPAGDDDDDEDIEEILENETTGYINRLLRTGIIEKLHLPEYETRLFESGKRITKKEFGDLYFSPYGKIGFEKIDNEMTGEDIKKWATPRVARLIRKGKISAISKSTEDMIKSLPIDKDVKDYSILKDFEDNYEKGVCSMMPSSPPLVIGDVKLTDSMKELLRKMKTD
jgi:hypothetical protein